MRLLLDTHALLWWMDDDGRLGPSARAAIADADLVLVSAATAWEISIKRALGQLRAPDDLAAQLDACSFVPLPITIRHALEAGALPRHHADPFDRMLAAQARLEGLSVVTADPRIGQYGVNVVAT